MRIHELVPTGEQVVIHNDATGHTMVLVPEGAVYNTEDTSDVRNIAIAFGKLFTSDQWRIATEEEREELRLHPPTAMMELSWVIPKPKPKPVLTVVKGRKADDWEPAKVIYEKDGMRIYDDDDTQ